MKAVDHRMEAVRDAGAPRAVSRAVLQEVYGSPDVLHLRQVPAPSPAANEVLVRISAASVNARDWHVMRGEPWLARLLDRGTFALRRPRVATRGTDLAGVVEAVGAHVTRWHVGDHVFGEGTATLADHAVVPADQLAATTALRCLDATGSVPGNSILVNGASGGVGTFAIQIAKARQLHVTAVVSTRNVALAASLGADRVIDYTSEDFARAGAQYDVLVDLVGNRALRELRRAVRPGGVLVLSGGGVSGTGRILGPLRLLIWGQVYGHLRGLRVHVPQAAPDPALLEQVSELVATRQLAPVIDRRFALEQAADAIRYMETEHTRGKVVVTTS